MTDPRLAEVAARLEAAVAQFSGEPADAAELFERFETTAIATLDSEHMNYEPGALEEYLRDYLDRKGRELLDD